MKNPFKNLFTSKPKHICTTFKEESVQGLDLKMCTECGLIQDFKDPVVTAATKRVENAFALLEKEKQQYLDNLNKRRREYNERWKNEPNFKPLTITSL